MGFFLAIMATGFATTATDLTTGLATTVACMDARWYPWAMVLCVWTGC